MKINVNSIELFYNKNGQGDPVILLHGNGQDHRIFRKITKRLSDKYTVYALDSRDHGRSSRVKSLDYISKMEDVAEFIQKLELKKPILYGFSDGGIIGLLLAARHPDILKKLIISGANTHPDEIKRFTFNMIKAGYFFTRNKKLKMMLTQPNITAEELNKILVPTLVLAGHHDIIKEENTRFIAENIPGSELRILKGENHTSYVLNNEKLYEIIKTFIEKE